MTEPYGVVGLTYRGTDCQEWPNGLFLEIVTGIGTPPQVRGRDTVIPARAFQNRRSRVATARSIVLEGVLDGDGMTEADRRADFRDRVLELFSGPGPLFDPTVAGDLVATLENGLLATITARTADVQDRIVTAHAARYSVSLEANWGDWVFAEVS